MRLDKTHTNTGWREGKRGEREKREEGEIGHGGVFVHKRLEGETDEMFQPLSLHFCWSGGFPKFPEGRF